MMGYVLALLAAGFMCLLSIAALVSTLVAGFGWAFNLVEGVWLWTTPFSFAAAVGFWDLGVALLDVAEGYRSGS